MLLGLSGKKQSGKDTVAKIIQYLTSGMIDIPNWIWLGKPVEWADIMNKEKISYHKWQIKKFADKLKDIVCLLIGCSREQLEDNDFKKRELGEGWERFKVTGTNSISTPFKTVYTATQKEAVQETKDFKTFSITKEKLTPRKLLQLIGTECGRQIIHPNIWINALMSEYKPTNNCQQHSDGLYYTDEHEENEIVPDFPNWLVTDVRFPNEVKAIKDKGGVVIRIERPSLQSNDIHESETSLDSYPFVYTINNNGTIDELIAQVKELLQILKII